jgi:hypothetical protein
VPELRHYGVPFVRRRAGPAWPAAEA